MIFSLIGLVLFAAAIIVFFIRRHSAALQAASVNWPTVEGKVTDAKIHAFRDKEKHMNYMGRVWFGYQVNGTNYSSEKISWGGRPYSPVTTGAQQVLDRYPIGSPVQVYYNPQKPKQSVLEPHEKGGLSTLTWIMVACVILGLVFTPLGFFIQP